MGKLIDIETIRKEIERLNNMEYPCDTSEQSTGFYDALERLEQFLDTLPEEKPVDLEKEIDDYISKHFYGSGTIGFLSNRNKDYPTGYDIALTARHFFNLGKIDKKD